MDIHLVTNVKIAGVAEVSTFLAVFNSDATHDEPRQMTFSHKLSQPFISLSVVRKFPCLHISYSVLVHTYTKGLTSVTFTRRLLDVNDHSITVHGAVGQSNKFSPPTQVFQALEHPWLTSGVYLRALPIW